MILKNLYNLRSMWRSHNIPLNLALCFRVLLFILKTGYLSATVESDMCMMIRRNDPDTGQLRWSIPSRKRCSCTRVANRVSNINNACPMDAPLQDLWFTEDAVVDQLIRKHNWKSEILDVLFDRIISCGKFQRRRPNGAGAENLKPFHYKSHCFQ